jgi:hypothetical protein
MLRFYLLMAVFISRLLRSLNAFLCFERKFLETHRRVLQELMRIVSLSSKAGRFDQSGKN